MDIRKEFEEYFSKLDTNLCSFERDYHNVDYFYDLIQVGTRTKDINILVKKCWALIEDYKNKNLIGTPDFGGALCVIGYNDNSLDLDIFSNLVHLFLSNREMNNPHCTRWQISLTYILAKLTNDINLYNTCFYSDYKHFNSLIVNKQLNACYKMAEFQINKMDDKEGAKKILCEGIELFKNALSFDLDKTVGNNGTYIYFSTCELAELCDKASELVKFYQNIDKYGTEEFEKILDNSKRFGTLPYIRSLEKRIKELEGKR